ncbi:hypothetical protein HD554DRAFT_2047034 [Boletus coccyginus]|nr:hypothetical protein HD554DRAFT_2047034 [Boletus coccyginus]
MMLRMLLPLAMQPIAEVGAWFPFSPALCGHRTELRATPYCTKHRITSSPNISGVLYALALSVQDCLKQLEWTRRDHVW